jgi:hypothetical protein
MDTQPSGLSPALQCATLKGLLSRPHLSPRRRHRKRMEASSLQKLGGVGRETISHALKGDLEPKTSVAQTLT